LFGEVAVDAVVAACPPQAHEEIAQAAVERGVGVFLEKPPAASTACLGRLAEAAEARKVTTGVGMNMRYAGPYLRIRELLARPEVGVPVSVTVRHVASKPRGSLWGLPPLRSFLLAQAIHPVDLMLNLTGPATAVKTLCRHDGTDTLVSIQALAVSGAVGQVLTGTYAPRFESRVEILTDAGVGITLTGLAELTVTGLPAADAAGGSRGWSQQWRPSPLDTGFERTGFQHELRAFLTAAASGAPFAPGLADLLPTFELLDRVEQGAAA
jgi:predicted dehydrogenase